MKNYPETLKANDIIRIVCPSGHLKREFTEKLIELLEKWNYKVQLGSTVGFGNSYFAGTDEERKNDLQMALDDPNVKAIFMGRGGYGMSRIIDEIDFTEFIKQPKWIVGFSDITMLLNHIYTHFQIPSIHGPMAKQFHDAFNFSANKALWNVNNIFQNNWKEYTFENNSEFNKNGYTEAVLVGGNLSLITHAIGTDSAIDFKGKILFIEEVGEYLYAIDRMLMQLYRVGVFQEIAGLIIGGFTELKDTVRPFGMDIKNIINSYVKNENYPVYFDFPAGHGMVNFPLIIGGNYSLKVERNSMHLQLIDKSIS